MKIIVKVGSVVIEYDQETEPREFAALVSRDKCSDGRMRGEYLLDTIKALADKAAEIHKETAY